MNTSEMKLRQAQVSDLKEMQELFVNTIQAICKNDYTPEQIEVWTSSVENTQRWIGKLTSQHVLIAELDHKMVGYASLEGEDYLDFLYVHKDYQRKGIANRLYAEIEQEAIKRKATSLHADVSETAKRFFEKRGFHTITPQTNLIKGVAIMNYKMTKTL